VTLSMNRRTFTIAAGASTLAVGSITRAGAQEASPVAEDAAGLPPLPDGATIYAEGLYNPRFLAFTDDGTLYVTEVGVGGDEPFGFGPPAEEASPVAEPVVEGTPMAQQPVEGGSTRGYTGQISAIAPDGTVTVAVSGLPSYSDGVGPHGITIQDGMIYFTVGGASVLAGVEPLEGENHVFSLDAATGTATSIADFNVPEIENNPDGTDVNPNLYGIAAGRNDGRLTVVDAGGNTVYSLDTATGAIQLRAIVPNMAELVPDAGYEPRQSVPTDVVYHSGGAFVTLLSEFWPEDVPSVVRIDGDGDFATLTPQAFGLSFVTGLASGPDGRLYVAQLFDDPEGPPMGTIFRVLPDQTVEPVVEGLVMPHGIVFDGDGNLYVTVYTLMSGPGMPAGAVVRVDGVAAPA
jgi:sugar lactone lactonase YvrE